MSTTLHRQTSTSSPRTPTRTRPSPTSITSGLVVDTGEPCAPITDCNNDWVCSGQRCIPSTKSSNIGGAPLGAPSVAVAAASATINANERQSADNTMGTGAAIGIGVGIGVLFIMVMGLGYCAWRMMKRRRERGKGGVREITDTNFTRTTSNCDGWVIDNDQRTLVNSAPTSPQQQVAMTGETGFTSSERPPDLPSSRRLEQLARSLSGRGSKKGKTVAKRRPDERDGPIHERDEERALNVDKELPAAPREHVSIHPPSLNVSINKSMIFDEEMLRAAAQVVPRDPPARETPARERLEGYHFEEYIPHHAGSMNASRNPLIRHFDTIERRDERYQSQCAAFSVVSSDAQSAKGSAYTPQLSRASSISRGDPDTLGDNHSRRDWRYSPQPPVPAIPPQLVLPEQAENRLSYDWYSAIIDAPPSPTALTYPLPQPRGSLAPAPLKLTILKPTVYSPPPKNPPPRELPANSDSSLHPNSAMLSPLSPTFPSLPTSTTLHSNSDIAFSNRVSHLSARSFQSRQSRQSRSWLPEDGVFLPNDGSEEAYELYRRSRYSPRATSYASRREPLP